MKEQKIVQMTNGKILKVERPGEYNIDYKFFYSLTANSEYFFIILDDFKIIKTSVVSNFLSTIAPFPTHAPALMYAFIKGGRLLKTSDFFTLGLFFCTT